MEIDDLSDTLSTYSDDEQDPTSVQVACLSNIVDLQRACQGENLKFSSETNRFLLYLTLKKLGPYLAQKLIQKLVDRGELEWDSEEDFEVEAILDYVKEDDKELYLIKWKGWANEHNTWEPKEHLGCAELLEQFHTNFESCSTRTELKRKLSIDGDDQPCKKRRIDDIWARISTKYQDNITPLKLLSVSQTTNKKYRGLNGLTVGQKQTAIPKLKRNRDINNKRTKAHRQLKGEIQAALKAWEKHLNEINTDPATISVENNVDLCGPPENFEYINDYKATGGVEIPMDPFVGCECDNCFEEKKQCCPRSSGADWAYYKHGKVRVPPGSPIYECNKRCTCGPDCPNRVVQHGRKHKVCIFRTKNGRGWGVKALQAIKKGSFVMEYVGEVITNEEAERRGKIYDAEGQTYLFDLDYNDGDCPFTVDAGFYGNVSHFVNHSCDPNLAVYGVWINTLDPRLPRIALFAKNDIKRGEELTFDYMMTGDTTHQLVAAEQIKEALKSAQEGQPLVMGHPPQPLVSAESQQLHVENQESVDSLQGEEESDDASSDNPKEDFHNEDATEVSSESGSADQLITQPSDDGDTPQNSENGDTPQEEPSEVLVSEQVEGDKNTFIGQPGEASPQPIIQYRMMCQCGAANCRKYLF